MAGLIDFDARLLSLHYRGDIVVPIISSLEPETRIRYRNQDNNVYNVRNVSCRFEYLSPRLDVDGFVSIGILFPLVVHSAKPDRWKGLVLEKTSPAQAIATLGKPEADETGEFLALGKRGMPQRLVWPKARGLSLLCVAT